MVDLDFVLCYELFAGVLLRVLGCGGYCVGFAGVGWLGFFGSVYAVKFWFGFAFGLLCLVGVCVCLGVCVFLDCWIVVLGYWLVCLLLCCWVMLIKLLYDVCGG